MTGAGAGAGTGAGAGAGTGAVSVVTVGAGARDQQHFVRISYWSSCVKIYESICIILRTNI